MSTSNIPLQELVEFSPSRYVSKLVYDSEKARVALFCLVAGQEVSPHTSSSEVVFVGIGGKGKVLLGEREVALEANHLVVCPPQVPHGLKAEDNLVVLAFIAPRPV